MKKLICITLATFLAATICAAEVNILTVHMETVYENYWKTVRDNEKIKADYEDAKETVQDRGKQLEEQLKELEKEINELREQATSDMLSDEAKEEKRNLFRKKIGEAEKLQTEFQQYQNELQRSFDLRIKTHRDLMIDEILKEVVDVAKEKQATVVFDTSDILQLGVPTVLYADDSVDITDEVIKNLNASKPAEE